MGRGPRTARTGVSMPGCPRGGSLRRGAWGCGCALQEPGPPTSWEPLSQALGTRGGEETWAGGHQANAPSYLDGRELLSGSDLFWALEQLWPETASPGLYF